MPWYCDLCDVMLCNIQMYCEHLREADHLFEIERSTTYECIICNKQSLSRRLFTEHHKSSEHISQEKRLFREYMQNKFEEIGSPGTCMSLNVMNLQKRCFGEHFLNPTTIVGEVNETNGTYFCSECNIILLHKGSLAKHLLSKMHQDAI